MNIEDSQKMAVLLDRINDAVVDFGQAAIRNDNDEFKRATARYVAEMSAAINALNPQEAV